MTQSGSDETFSVNLTDDERNTLRHGLTSWPGGGGHSDEIARLIGFKDAKDLSQNAWPLADRLGRREPLTQQEWTRAIKALEFGFASEDGAGYEWSTITGLRDEETLRALRSLQKKLVSIRFRRRTDE
jgi:hypothetical protein